MNENTDNHKEQKMEKRGLLRRMCWKAEGQQLPSRGVSAATWQPKWKIMVNCRWKDITVKRGASVSLYSILKWLHLE